MGKGNILLFLVASIILFMFSFQSEARDIIKVDIGTFEFPPMFHTSVAGNLSGTIGETVKKICKNGDLEYTVAMFPIKRAYHHIENGKFDILITASHHRFHKSATASDWQYPWAAGFFSKKALNEIPDNKQDLIGKQIIIILDWQSPYKVFENLNELEINGKIYVHHPTSISSAIRMLNADRAPFLWGSENFKWTFNQLNIDYSNFHYKPLTTIPIVLWVSKRSKKYNKILRRLNDSFRQLKKEGILNEKNLLTKELMKIRYENPKNLTR